MVLQCGGELFVVQIGIWKGENGNVEIGMSSHKTAGGVNENEKTGMQLQIEACERQGEATGGGETKLIFGLPFKLTIPGRKMQRTGGIDTKWSHERIRESKLSKHLRPTLKFTFSQI